MSRLTIPENAQQRARQMQTTAGAAHTPIKCPSIPIYY